jgi:hypothetical protein
VPKSVLSGISLQGGKGHLRARLDVDDRKPLEDRSACGAG